MKNREKYADFLIECAIRGTGVAVTNNGNPCVCGDLDCNDCLFNNPTLDCAEMTRKWADAECEEQEIDWSKVPVDTKMWVRSTKDKPWIPRHYSGLRDFLGNPLVFEDGCTSFSCERNSCGKPMLGIYLDYKFAEDIRK